MRISSRNLPPVVGIGALILALMTPLAAATNWDELTPFGAERKGNSAGTIPEWDGGIRVPVPGYVGPGSLHADPFAGDEPLYSVSSSNSAQHNEVLTEGLRALLTRYPESFRVPVYPSRRSHSAPDWVYENTRLNDDRGTLAADGNGVSGAYGGIPFPTPDSALEVYWNHVARWRGQYIESRSADANVYADGKASLITRETQVKFHFYQKDGSADTLQNRLFSLMSKVTAPPRFARTAVLIQEPLNQDVEDRQAWIYDSGRRRVLRAPLLAFDMGPNDADGLRTADDTDMINGSPSRFDWTLVGKQELLIPYNNYRLEVGDEAELLKAGHLNPERTRFELHRVWVIEATLKPEFRHVYARRVFYIDEDSWSVVMADQYDKSGELSRVSIAYLKNFYELPGTLPAAYVFHDLASGRYSVQGLAVGDSEAETLKPAPNDGHFNSAGLGRFVQ